MRIWQWAISHPARAAVGAGWYQQGCTTVGALISIPLILDILGQSQAGFWFALQGLLIMVALADFGFSPAISRQAAHSLHLVPNERQKLSQPDLINTRPGWSGISELYGSSKVLFGTVAATAVLLMIFLDQAVLPHTRLFEVRTVEKTATYYALGISLVLVVQARLSQSFLDGIGLMFVSRIVGGTYGLLWNLASAVAVVVFRNLLCMALAVLVASAIQLAAMHIVLRFAAAGRINFAEKPSRPLLRQLWKVAIPFGIVESGVYLVGAIQVPLLGAILGAASVAPYYLAARLGQTLHTTIQQITLTQMPLFTQQLAAGHVTAARRRFCQTLYLGIILYLAAGLFIYFGSPSLVRLWVGAGRYVGPFVLLVFTMNFVAAGFATIPAHFVLASGSNPFAKMTLLQGFFAVIGSIFLCAKQGIAGIPLASLIAGLLTAYWFNPWKAVQLWQQLAKFEENEGSSRAIAERSWFSAHARDE